MGIFDDEDYNARKYGVPDHAGTEADWKAAYEDRMGKAEYEEVLGSGATKKSPESEAILILEITTTTITADVIKTKFRKLVMTVHPDHGGTDEAFKRLRAAYSLLMDLYG